MTEEVHTKAAVTGSISVSKPGLHIQALVVGSRTCPTAVQTTLETQAKLPRGSVVVSNPVVSQTHALVGTSRIWPRPAQTTLETQANNPRGSVVGSYPVSQTHSLVGTSRICPTSVHVTATEPVFDGVVDDEIADGPSDDVGVEIVAGSVDEVPTLINETEAECVDEGKKVVSGREVVSGSETELGGFVVVTAEEVSSKIDKEVIVLALIGTNLEMSL
ncbi:MAG: hypothetical protein CL912_13000 [Deltaproteobacteria bacterium]|nr:hypothetical protein [Deltaproteobacteria bacterium]